VIYHSSLKISLFIFELTLESRIFPPKTMVEIEVHPLPGLHLTSIRLLNQNLYNKVFVTSEWWSNLGKTQTLGHVHSSSLPFANAHFAPVRFTSPRCFSRLIGQTMTHPFARRLAAGLAAPSRSSHHASHRVRRC